MVQEQPLHPQQRPSYLINPVRNGNNSWQSGKDIGQRREMMQNIVALVKQRDKNPSQVFLESRFRRFRGLDPEWLNKLPQMVQQLEVSLYRSAESFEAYADKSTLKQRLRALIKEFAKKIRLAHLNG